jgi:hypothetical protein
MPTPEWPVRDVWPHPIIQWDVWDWPHEPVDDFYDGGYRAHVYRMCSCYEKKGTPCRWSTSTPRATS